MAGLREQEAQQVCCPNCERAHFILPINPYPEPKRVKKKRKRRRRNGESLKKVALRKGGDLWKRARQGVHRLTVGAFRRLVSAFVSVLTGIRNWFTPLRTAISLLVLILGFGGAYGYRQQMRAHALQRLRNSITQAERALQQQEWNEATEQFQLAAEAVEQLGRQDQLARKVIQKNRELQAIDGLCALPVDDIIRSASGQAKRTLSWQTEFKTMVQNRWFVMESWVTLDATEDRSEAILSFPLPVGEQKVTIVWPADLFRDFDSQGELHVLCAGQIESIERTDSPRFDWVVKMRPDSAFLWCFEETLDPLGFELDSPWLPQDSLRAVLERQRLMLDFDNGEDE